MCSEVQEVCTCPFPGGGSQCTMAVELRSGLSTENGSLYVEVKCIMGNGHIGPPED